MLGMDVLRMDHRHIIRYGLTTLVLCLMCQGLIFDEDLGDLLPNDPQGLADENLYMTCTLNMDHEDINRKYNASQLYFNVSGREVRGAPGVQVLNETTAMLIYRLNITQDRSFIECVLDTASDRAYIGQQYLWVGYRPHKMTIDEVYVENWRTLIFAVNKSVNGHYVTTDELWWKLQSESDSSYKRCAQLIEEVDSPGTITCTVENFGERFIRSEDQQLWISIKANASNVVGTTETIEEFLVKDIVKPGKMRNLEVAASTINPHKLIVSWTPPVDSHSYNCEIAYSDEWTNELKMVKSGERRVELKDLIPFTLYTVSVQCNSVYGGFPSDTVIATGRTSPAVPALNPEMLPGSFYSEQTETSKSKRNVTIYWKSVAQKYLQGELVSYVLILANGTWGRKYKVEGKYTNHTFPNLDTEREYSVYVEVQNTVGLNNTGRIPKITIPSQTKIVNEIIEPSPLVFMDNDTVVKVHLDPDKNAHRDVLFFWCQKGLKSSSVPTCSNKGELQVRNLTAGINVISDLTEGFRKYEFGYGTNISGIKWEDRVYHLHDNAKPPEIRKKEVHERSIELYLVPQYYRYKGYATKFSITWCPSTDTKCPVDAPRKVISRDEVNNVVIDDLEPDTEYLLEAQSYTLSNLESFEPSIKKVHTKPPNGGLAPWNIVLISVAFLILVVGVSCCVYCCGSKIKSFFGAKIGTPDLNEVVTVRSEGGQHPGAYSPLIEVPTAPPPIITTQYETPDELRTERTGTYGSSRSIVEDDRSEADSDYTEGKFLNDSGGQYHVLGSGETSYDQAHVPDETEGINLRKKPPQTYTKDNSSDKKPDFKFGVKNKEAAKDDIPLRTLVADGCSEPKPDAKEFRPKKLKSRKERDLFSNPGYDRGESTDSSSSSAPPYAPAKLHVGPLNEIGSSNDDTDVSDYPKVHAAPVAPHDAARVNEKSNSATMEHTKCANPTSTDRGSASSYSDSPKLYTDSGISKNGSSSSVQQDEDGLGWDSSDDDEPPYKDRLKEVKHIIDPKADFVDPEEMDLEDEADTGNDAYKLGLAIA